MTDFRDLLVKAKAYHYVAYVSDVYDGDTCTLEPVDLGLWTQAVDIGVRWEAINSAELRGGTAATKRRGVYVRDYVEGMILDQWVLVVTSLDRSGRDKKGKHGRLIGQIIAPRNGIWINVNRHLVDEVGVPFQTFGAKFDGWVEPGDVLDLAAD